MRIIAAEVCITPEGQPEVELGMLPLDVDLPGPWAGMLAKAPEMSFEYRRAIIAQRQAAMDAVTSSSGRTVSVRLTLHTSRGDLTIRQQVVLGEEEPEQPGATDPSDLPREQYRALLRSVERKPVASDPGGDDLLGIHAWLPRRPIAPNDHVMAVFPVL